jgi:hypothetical protein
MMKAKYYSEAQAMNEGWLLSSRDDGFWQIQKYDDDDKSRFPDDDTARLNVEVWALVGAQPIHVEAVRLHGKRWR